MGVVKRSVSIDQQVAELVDAAAEQEGVSFSAWLTQAAERQLHLARGERGVAEWEAEAGALTADERAAGALLLSKLMDPRRDGDG